MSDPRSLGFFGLVGLLAAVGCHAAPSTPVDPSSAAAAKKLAKSVKEAEEKLDDYLPLYNQRQRSSFQAEWDVIGLGESRTRAVLSTGWGVSVTPWMPEGAPGMRFLTFSTMLHTGDYGDTQYDAFHIQFGHDPHFAIYETTAVELQLGSRFRYTMTGAGQSDISGPEVLVDNSRDANLRSSFSFGGTVGARLAEGAITVELFAEGAYAITEPYLGPVDDPSDVTRWKPRGGVTVKTDLCFQLGFNDHHCYYDQTAQENVDLGSVLRRALRRIEREPKPPPGNSWHQRPLCQAAAKGVVLAPLGQDDDCSGFEAEGFFCRTEGALSDETLRGRVADVHRVHNELEACTALQRRHSVDARANERSLKIRLQYGAYAPELRSELGCDPKEPTPQEDAQSPRSEETKARLEQEKESERRDATRACELCPRACPEGAWWLKE